MKLYDFATDSGIYAQLLRAVKSVLLWGLERPIANSPNCPEKLTVAHTGRQTANQTMTLSYSHLTDSHPVSYGKMLEICIISRIYKNFVCVFSRKSCRA